MALAPQKHAGPHCTIGLCEIKAPGVSEVAPYTAGEFGLQLSVFVFRLGVVSGLSTVWGHRWNLGNRQIEMMFWVISTLSMVNVQRQTSGEHSVSLTERLK